MTRIGLLVGFLAALSCVPQHQAWADDPLARVVGGRNFDQFMEATLHDYGVPGAVVAVTNADSSVFVKGYGVRRLGASEKVDSDTRFQIASLSKFVAATAVGVLVDKDVMSWDTPVRTFSPETQLSVPYATEYATLRDYFAHRTGLPPYTGVSNYGIFLGQQAAAHAAGLSPADLLSSTILQPLGMTRSGPVIATLMQDDNRAVAHNFDGSVMPYENVDAFSGAGAVVSTGSDIAHFMRMLLGRGTFEGRTILSPATVTQIFAPSMVQGVGPLLQDPNDSSGLGCESYHFLQYRVIEKNGALNGMRTVMTLIPERRIGIAVFANKQLTVFPEAVRAEFLERELGPSGRDLQAQIHEEQKGWQSLLDLPKPPTDAKPLVRDLDAFTGRYASELYGSMEVVQDGGELAVRIGEMWYPGHLMHWSGDSFLLTFDNPDAGSGLLTFTFDGDSARASGIEGSAVPRSLTANFGRFARAS